MARRRNREILWSLMTRIKSPHSFQVRRFSSGTENGSAGVKSKASSKKSSEKSSSSSNASSSKSPSRARLCLIVSAIAPGLTFGVFVVVGNAAAVVSAGAVVPSLLVAAVASLLAGLCLIELVTWQRPCPDSLYACLYRWAGEAAAFAAGWLSLLHQGAAIACVARLQSSAIDALSGGALARAWQALGSYDPVALALGLVAASVAAAPRLLSSSREPTWLGMALIALSLLSALFFVAMGSVGATAAPGNSWSFAMLMLSDSAPTGLLSGAALCTYAFIGPHTALRRAPDSPQPWRDLPLALGLSTALTFLLTFSMAVVVTIQARHDTARPLAAMLASCSAEWAGTAMSAASLLALVGLALYGLLPLGGAVRSLAADGLLFRGLAKTSNAGRPVGSILAAGALAAGAALVAPVPRLLGLMAVGPLALNAAVCVALLLARYHPASRTAYDLIGDESPPAKEGSAAGNGGGSSLPASSTTSPSSSACSSSSEDEEDIDALVREYRERLRVAALTDGLLAGNGGNSLREPTSATARRADLAVSGVVAALVVLSVAMEVGSRLEGRTASVCAVISTLCAVAVAALLVLLSRQPQVQLGPSLLHAGAAFRVPMVPWLPCIGAFLNVCLLVDLLVSAWLVFVCWLAIGVALYLLYGIHSSTAASEIPLPTAAAAGSPRQPSPKISLQPLALQPHSIVSHIVPSHRSHPGSQRRLAELDTVFIQH
ncbi:cationic amino acid transporter 2-like [Dermacentor andersoni]|uniref:cationic amino acid transporter 2-like n=1 Tax=Dermacentor andersoni TaxID=34620 RepID=UPI002155012E|nr:cationic amino acid transporter 2-like [Dermacentor andersoni]